MVVACGPPRLVEDADHDTLLNPQLIVEVLSPSTESWDRGGKFGHYRTVPSLTDYVLVSQDRLLIEHFTRQPGERWLLTAANSLEAVIETSLGAQLVLADVYERVPGLAATPVTPRAVG